MYTLAITQMNTVLPTQPCAPGLCEILAVICSYQRGSMESTANVLAGVGHDGQSEPLITDPHVLYIFRALI